LSPSSSALAMIRLRNIGLGKVALSISRIR
jgi:hypothetical protein